MTERSDRQLLLSGSCFPDRRFWHWPQFERVENIPVRIQRLDQRLLPFHAHANVILYLDCFESGFCRTDFVERGTASARNDIVYAGVQVVLIVVIMAAEDRRDSPPSSSGSIFSASLAADAFRRSMAV